MDPMDCPFCAERAIAAKDARDAAIANERERCVRKIEAFVKTWDVDIRERGELQELAEKIRAGH